MPKPHRKPRLRTIQPPHPSDKFTLEEAMEAWRWADEQLARARAAAESHCVTESTVSPEPPDGETAGTPHPTPTVKVSG
jgi:hypothetical protein